MALFILAIRNLDEGGYHGCLLSPSLPTLSVLIAYSVLEDTQYALLVKI